MADLKDLFYAGKFKQESLVGENNFFKTKNEIKEFSRLQEKFIPNINYYNIDNFCKFGSAEEYYKNAISYINSDYPFDKSKEEKLSWINNLNDFEYHIYLNEYPKYAGILYLSGSQYLKVFSPSQDYNQDSKTTYKNGVAFYSTSSLDFNYGFSFETWLNVPTSSLTTNILKINNVLSSSGGLFNNSLLALKLVGGNFVISGTNGEYTFNNYSAPNNVWQHISVNFNSSSLNLFVNGQLTQSVSSVNLNNDRKYKFSKIGLLSSSYLESWTLTGSYTVQPTFEIGSASLLQLDETRFWNEPRTPESVGRNWFKPIDGNDFNDPFNNNLIFYYKFNEGWSQNLDFCLDYSGRKNDGIIVNYSVFPCRFSGSAINSASLSDDLENGDVIIESNINNTGSLKSFYDAKILSGSQYDERNVHSLYNKFPSWIIEEEQENNPKHLKQIVQIVSSYFDDLYHKISEVSKFKHYQNTVDNEKVYPFYDKILSSTGFDLTDLFLNLDFIEKVSSRNETNLYDVDIQKVKNLIYQNIYNNLLFILKSKGTKKSIKAFLRSYGVNENLIKINLYADNALYNANNKKTLTTGRKKTLTFDSTSSIYSTSSVQITSLTSSYTLENSIIFPKAIELEAPYSSSLFGFSFSTLDRTYTPFTAYSYLETNTSGTRFIFASSSVFGDTIIGSSSYFQNVYDNTAWNFAFRFKLNVDTFDSDYLLSASTNVPFDVLELTGTNRNGEYDKSFAISTSLQQNFFRNVWISSAPYLNFYVGAKNQNLTGSNQMPTYIKSVYCNVWDTFLSDNEIISHNEDITSYGADN